MIRPTAWGSDWFLGLSLPLRLAWQFILSHADYAGVFDLEKHRLLLRMVCETPLEQVRDGLGDRVHVLAPTLWQVRGFVPQQYPRDYAAQLNGIQARVLKELRRVASIYGHAVLEVAFDGCPCWPELEAKPSQGGVDPRPAGGGPRVHRGSTGREGRAGHGPALPSTPPSNTENEGQNTDSAPDKDAGPGMNAEDLDFAELSMRWQAAGYVLPDWPPFTRKDVQEAVRRFGLRAVDFAAKRFLDTGGDNLTPRRFGRELGDWLRSVPANLRKCQVEHTWEGALVPRSDFPAGPQLRVRRCTWCGHTEPAAGSVEASTERPPCAHTRLSEPLKAPEGDVVAALDKATLEALLADVGSCHCLDCGAKMPKGVRA